MKPTFLTFEPCPDVVVTEAQQQRFVHLISQSPDMVADIIGRNNGIESALADDDVFAEMPGPKLHPEYKDLFEREIQKYDSSHLLGTAVSRSLHRYRREIPQ